MAKKDYLENYNEERYRTATPNAEGIYENTGEGTVENRKELAGQREMIAQRDKPKGESQKSHGIQSWFSRLKL